MMGAIEIGSIYRICNWVWKESAIDRFYAIPARVASDDSKFMAETWDTRGDISNKTLCHCIMDEIDTEDDPLFKMIEVKSSEDMRDAIASILSCDYYAETEDDN